MAEVTSVSPADLRAIENHLRAIYNDVQSVNDEVSGVRDNVKIMNDELGALARDFHNYVLKDIKDKRLALAHGKLVQIRQELEKKYGHYDVVRRTTSGILQADDLGVIKKETISEATEEMMIATPDYWLAPCLVALAAWINDQPELAGRALREAIKRNDEKTSLFFALVCRRAGRGSAAMKWLTRYFETQDEENLDRKSIVVLDAYTSGLLGTDAEGAITRRIDEWTAHFEQKPGFVERQTKQWSDAIKLKRKPFGGGDYEYLPKYSRTWSRLCDVAEGALLHEEILDYFTAIFEQKISASSLEAQLDAILSSLVTDFDDEELPLRREEKFEQLVIDFAGDDDRARRNMETEKTAFETHKDFTQLLTDAAMKPQSAHASASTQKFAIALSKEWIKNAYNDVTAENRANIPNEIEINVDTFNASTEDGENEEDLIEGFDELVRKEKEVALAPYALSFYDKFLFCGGAAIALLGAALAISGSLILGAIAVIGGVSMIAKHLSRKKAITAARDKIASQFDDKRVNGEQIIRALLAEVVDFRATFAEEDAKSVKVTDFLSQIAPNQYIHRTQGSTRRIKTTG